MYVYDTSSPDMAPIVAIFIVLLWLTIAIVSIGLTLLIWCRLFSRAGFHWAMGLLMLVPIANIIMPLYLAFAEWPVLRQLKALQNRPTA